MVEVVEVPVVDKVAAHRVVAVERIAVHRVAVEAWVVEDSGSIPIEVEVAAVRAVSIAGTGLD